MTRIAYVSQQLGRGTAYGGGLVARTNLSLLQGLPNTDVQVFSISVQPVPGACHIQSTTSRAGTAWANLNGFSATLDRQGNARLVQAIRDFSPDLLWMDSSLLGRTLASLRRHEPALRSVTFFHNVEFDLQFGRARKENWLYLLSTASDWVNERMSTRLSDTLVALHAADAERLRQLYGRGADQFLPVVLPDAMNGAAEVPPRPSPSSPLLFVGSLYGPNVEGIKFFVDEVMPHVQDRLVIVGKGLETLRGVLTRPNVEVVGTVDELGGYYRAARCVVAPIFSGGGMKVKIAEALMHGLPVIGTPQALVGYEAVFQKGCLRSAATAADFIKALSTPFDDQAGAWARAGYLENYSMPAARQRMNSIVADSLASPLGKERCHAAL